MISHSKISLTDSISEIKSRLDGSATVIPTGITRLDSALLGGLEPWRIITLAGMSGSGKSTILEQITDNLLMNSNNLRVLNFSFEMLGKDTMLKLISNRIKKTLEELFSDKSILESQQFKDAVKSIEERDYFVEDEHLTIEQLEKVIIDFVNKSTDKFVLVTLDHTLLCKGNKQSDGDKDIIDDLYKMLIRLKKKFFAEKKKVSFIMLGQLNRDIEMKDRILNNILHFPNRNDLFAASSTYYSSDVVVVIHCPANIPAMQANYGPSMKNFPKGLPLRINGNKILYMHLIKTRFSAPNKMIPFVEDFKYSSVSEIQLIDENTYKLI